MICPWEMRATGDGMPQDVGVEHGCCVVRLFHMIARHETHAQLCAHRQKNMGGVRTCTGHSTAEMPALHLPVVRLAVYSGSPNQF